jgi:hypothetical protein
VDHDTAFPFLWLVVWSRILCRLRYRPCPKGRGRPL